MKIRFFFLFLVPFLSCFGCDNNSQTDLYFSENHHSPLTELIDEAEKDLLTEKPLDSIIKFSKFLETGEDAILACRAFFGRALAFALEGFEDQAISDLNSMDQILNQFACEECRELTSSVSDQEMLGPDELSVEDCLDRVTGTETAALAIVSSLPIKLALKSTIIGSITALSYKAKQRCRQGGVWKSCLKPLLEKWKFLNLWKKFGIPPDPMWD